MINDTLIKTRIEKIFDFVNQKVVEANVEELVTDDLIKGKLGLLMYCLNSYHLNQEDVYLEKIQEILEDIFNKISLNESIMAAHMTLADGLPALGIVLHELLKQDLIDSTFKDQIDVITDSVFDKCIEMINNNNFDYFYGATGLLFYMYKVEAYNNCNFLVDKLHEYALSHDYMFYNATGDVYTQGINFGFAHGTSAILAVLLKIYDQGINQQKTKELLLNITTKIISFKKENIDRSKVSYQLEGFDFPTWFPYNIITERVDKIVKPELYSTNIYHFTDRLGWCNSDLGYVMLFYKLGITLDQQEYLKISNEIGDEIVTRLSFENTAINSANMCHGSAGVSALYKSIYSLTNREIYKNAHEHWLNATVKYLEIKMKKEFSFSDLEILTGWLGPVLFLQDVNFKKVSNWDSFFLI